LLWQDQSRADALRRADMSDRIVAPTAASIALAAKRLRDGELVAFPTETVYGLGADAGNAGAVHRIFAAKGRPSDHPVIVHVAKGEQVAHWAREFPEGARKLAAEFWPGPLTLILPRAPHVGDAVTGGQDSVGLRMPSHPVAQALLAAFTAAGGSGIAAPSANRFGHVSPTTARHVADDLGDAVAMILDGGACDVGIESTIVAFTGTEPMLLRPGGIGIDDLTRVLGATPRAPDASAPRASGTLASHYAPHARLRLVAPAALLQEIAGMKSRGERAAVLALTVARPVEFTGTWITASADAAHYAHDLYASLRALDTPRVATIVVENVPETSPWLAVRDRLTRAAHSQ
jgi:L-threonylcarbamoyladenylate synthase